jgi:tRNA threonylcarbamoyladenosine biosynthesis protein TsaB
MYYGFLPVSEKMHGLQKTDLFCPALDARRMEIYYSIFDTNGKTYRDIRAEIMDTDSFSDIPGSSRIFFFGEGAPKIKELIKRKNCIFDDRFTMSASFMLIPAYEAIDRNLFEDLAYFEPFYLKDFLTSKPVKNLL